MKLIHGDCLIEHEKIKSGSVDLILTDLPYGTIKGLGKNIPKYKRLTNVDWDVVINTDSIMEIANRILRKNGKMALFAQQPFTTELISKAIPNLPHSYNVYWDKMHFANCLLANKAPVSYIEDVLLFSKQNPIHDSEFIHPLRPYSKKLMEFIGLGINKINEMKGDTRCSHMFSFNFSQFSLCTEETYNWLIKEFNIDQMKGFKPFTELREIDLPFKADLNNTANSINPSTFNLWEGKKYKSNILKYKKDYTGFHPTQKPVLLLEDLIKTFSNKGDLVVDLTMGSGSTGVACKNTNRDFIGIELDDKYFEIAKNRIESTTSLFN